MTNKPRVILDAKAWQEGLMTTEGVPISTPIRRHGSSSMNPNASIWALMTDSVTSDV
jgi:hypothetical protein